MFDISHRHFQFHVCERKSQDFDFKISLIFAKCKRKNTNKKEAVIGNYLEIVLGSTRKGLLW